MTQPDDQFKQPPAHSSLLVAAAYLVGVVRLLPALLLLIMIGAVAWYGVRVVWQLASVLLA